MSEQFAVGEVRDLPAVQFTTDGTVYEPDPAPTATLILEDNSTSGLTFTKQGTGTNARYLVQDFSRNAAGQFEVRYETTDTDADIMKYVEYISVIDSSSASVLEAIEELETIITASGVTIISPFDGTGNLNLIRGDSYLAADGREITWTSEDWGDYNLFVSDTVTFRARSKYSSTVFEKALTVVDGATVYLELETDETENFVVGTRMYKFDVTLERGGEMITLERGSMSVAEDII